MCGETHLLRGEPGRFASNGSPGPASLQACAPSGSAWGGSVQPGAGGLPGGGQPGEDSGSPVPGVRTGVGPRASPSAVSSGLCPA